MNPRFGTAFMFLMILHFGSAPAQVLLWSDEFDTGSQPDPATWSYDLGGHGWGNQELQNYTNEIENVSVADGSLHIVARRDGDDFTSARIRSEDKVAFRYGTVEARIKIPDLADGLWPAFWTLGNNFSSVGWPHCGELDVMEMGSSSAINDGVTNRRVGSTAHWEHQGSPAEYGLFLDAPADLNDNFHLFRMEWTPTTVTTFLDGEIIWVIDISPENCTDCSEFHQPHFMILNLAVGGSFTGRTFAGSITAPAPAEMLVDYVRIYDNGFTELSGTGASNLPRPIGPAHSGSWYNVDQSGHGFSMEFGELPDGSPLAVIYWYTYDNAGSPLFFVGTGVPDGNTVEVDFLSPVGMVFGEFDPASVVREAAGSAQLTFDDQDHGTFSYQPSEFSTERWGHAEVSDLPLDKLFSIPVSN